MTDLHLVMADKALRAAIAEQLALGTAGDIGVIEHDALGPFVEPPALVIDEEQMEAITPLAEKAAGTGSKIKIFLLGETQNTFSEKIEAGASLESFAKPLRLGHLLARIQFYFQAARGTNAPFSFGPFRLEPAQRQAVTESGTAIRLTEKETQLLEYIGRSPHPVPREELLAAIWGYDGRIDTHTLETHIYRLRRKLDPEGRFDDLLAVRQGAYNLLRRDG